MRNGLVAELFHVHEVNTQTQLPSVAVDGVPVTREIGEKPEVAGLSLCRRVAE